MDLPAAPNSFCGAGRPQSSLRDSRVFAVEPSVETLGYSRWSLRDNKAAVSQHYDLRVVTRPHHMGEGAILLSFHPPLRVKFAGVRSKGSNKNNFEFGATLTLTKICAGARSSGRFTAGIASRLSFPQRPRACATRKRRKRRAPSVREATTLNTYSVGRGRVRVAISERCLQFGTCFCTKPELELTEKLSARAPDPPRQSPASRPSIP